MTGTGTGVGKTLVTASICHQLRALNRSVHALKPVISGYTQADFMESDSAVLLQSLGIAPDEGAIDKISPWRFEAPISPDMAARRERRRLSLDAIVNFCHKAQAKWPDGNKGTLLIEGVGGPMVPLNKRHTVMDWMAALGVPSLLVAGSYLGTISHTLTTVEAMRAHGVPPVALIVSESEENPVPIAETVETLSRFLEDMPIVVVERIAGQKKPWERGADLAHLVMTPPKR